MIDIEGNWQKLLAELRSIQRPGMDNLICYLEKDTDFKTAPASTKFHLSEQGGLTAHSLNVLKYGRLVNSEMNRPCSDESVTIATLMHDLCKANYYVLGEEWDKEYKEKYNQWRKIPVWKVKDQLPLGHGEKSVIMAARHIELTPEEMAAIRWHMVGFDAGIHFNYPSGFPFRESMNNYPLLKVVILADQMAELFESLPHEKVATEGEEGQQRLLGATN